MKILWHLKQILKENRISGRALATEAGLTPQAISRLVKDEGPEYIHRPTLIKIVTALRSLTGEEVSVSDLLEYTED